MGPLSEAVTRIERLLEGLSPAQGWRALLFVAIAAAVLGLLLGGIAAACTHFFPRLTRNLRGLTGRVASAWPMLPLALLALSAALLSGLLLSQLTASFFELGLHRSWAGWCAAVGVLLLLLHGLARNLSQHFFFLGLTLVVATVGGTALGSTDQLRASTSSWWLPVWALGSAMAMRWLGTTNARFRPRGISIQELSDPAGNGRHDLERLLEEGFYKASFHSPSPVPGGVPLHWKRLTDDLSKLEGKDGLSAVLRSLGTLLRLTEVPHSLLIKGAVIPNPPTHRLGKQGVRIQATDSRTGDLVLADTFWGDNVHEAVELASYGIVASAFYRCPYLPEWVLWEGRDGLALREYWRGCEALKNRGQGLRPGEGSRHARAHFHAAAAQSPGTAYATFQLAGLMELEGIRKAVGWTQDGKRASPMPGSTDLIRAVELYSDLLARHPTLLLGWYRLASLLGNAAQWLPKKESEQQTVVLRVYHALSSLKGAGPRLDLDAWKVAATPPRVSSTALQASRCILQWLAASVNWRVLRWCALSLPARRWFSLSLLYPATERLALHRSLLASEDCAHMHALRRECDGCGCHGPMVRLIGLVRARGGANGWLTRKKLQKSLEDASKDLKRSDLLPLFADLTAGEHAEHCQELLDLLNHADALEQELDRLSRYRGEWWGAVLYALACFDAQLLALAKQRGSKSFRRPAHSAVAVDHWAERAVTLLRRSARDVKGPLGEDRRRWFEVDPDLEALRMHPRYKHWRNIYAAPRPPLKRDLCVDGPKPPGGAQPASPRGNGEQFAQL